MNNNLNVHLSEIMEKNLIFLFVNYLIINKL